MQEAAYSTLDKKSRQDIHARIAKGYIEAISEGCAIESIDNLFDIVEHLNKGRADFPDKKNLYQDIRFNYHAGKKAVNALALAAANRYFKESMALITEEFWDTDYEFTFSLYKDSAKSELTLGNQNESEHLLKTLLAKVKSPIDNAECLNEQATNLLSLGLVDDAIKKENQALAFIATPIPKAEDDVQRNIIKGADLIRKKKIDPEELIKNTAPSGRKDTIEHNIYKQLMGAYYFIGKPSCFNLTSILASNLVLSTAINEHAAFPFSIYTSYLFENEYYDEADLFFDLVIKLFDKYPDFIGTVNGITGFCWTASHWKHHLKKTAQLSRRAIEQGKIFGEVFYVGTGYCALIWSVLMQSNDLDKVESYVMECKDFSKKYNMKNSEDIALGISAAWIEPIKAYDINTPIKNLLKQWRKDFQDNQVQLGNYYIFAGMAQYFLGNYKKADEYFKNGEGYLNTHASNIPNRAWHIFSLLNSLRFLDANAGQDKNDELISKINPFLEKIKLWVRFGPAFKPYLAFIEAEIERVKGDFSQTRRLYLDAIDIAHEEEYTLLEGFIHESLGELLLKRGIDQAGYHIKKSANLYKKCHAEAKLKQIRKKYPEYITSQDNKKNDPVQRLDTVYMMKAAQAIYQELDINKLLQVVMRLLMEMTGARKTYLLTEKDDDFVVRIKGEKKKHISITLTKEPLSNKTGISRAMVRYVHRTKKTLILSNAARQGDFSNDRETVELGIRSVIMHPIMRQSKLMAIVCLQNNLVKSVFTENEVEMIKQLTTHAAVAMENAALVENMKKAEKTIKRSLAEKEILLSEIHHRVKNNLQIISSLLRLQSNYVFDQRDIEMFNESCARIQSMALIHEKLYKSETGDMANINFGDYLKDIVRDLVLSYSVRQNVSVKIEAEDIYLSLDTAIPCGLLINELVTNSLKYAFVDGEGGEIKIKLDDLQDNKLKLIVSDNGCGMPDGIDLKDSKTFGTRLISILAERQLKGFYELDNTHGVSYTVVFSRL